MRRLMKRLKHKFSENMKAYLEKAFNRERFKPNCP